MTQTAPMPATTTTIEPIKVVAGILQSELGLAAGKVMLGDEKYDIPTAPGLYVALRYVGPGKPIGASSYFEDVTLAEVQTVTMVHSIQIDAMSFDDSARIRKEEILMALESFYSQNAQVLNNLQIARLTSPFVNVSDAEPSGMMKRFMTTINVTALHRKVKATSADYYDKFNAGATDADPIKPPEVTPS